MLTEAQAQASAPAPVVVDTVKKFLISKPDLLDFLTTNFDFNIDKPIYSKKWHSLNERNKQLLILTINLIYGEYGKDYIRESILILCNYLIIKKFKYSFKIIIKNNEGNQEINYLSINDLFNYIKSGGQDRYKKAFNFVNKKNEEEERKKEIKECNICVSDYEHNEKDFIKCSNCRNLNICLSCFDVGNLESCPICRTEDFGRIREGVTSENCNVCLSDYDHNIKDCIKCVNCKNIKICCPCFELINPKKCPICRSTDFIRDKAPEEEEKFTIDFIHNKQIIKCDDIEFDYDHHLNLVFLIPGTNKVVKNFSFKIGTHEDVLKFFFDKLIEEIQYFNTDFIFQNLVQQYQNINSFIIGCISSHYGEDEDEDEHRRNTLLEFIGIDGDKQYNYFQNKKRTHELFLKYLEIEGQDENEFFEEVLGERMELLGFDKNEDNEASFYFEGGEEYNNNIRLFAPSAPDKFFSTRYFSGLDNLFEAEYNYLSEFDDPAEDENDLISDDES